MPISKSSSSYKASITAYIIIVIQYDQSDLERFSLSSELMSMVGAPTCFYYDCSISGEMRIHEKYRT